MHHSTSWWVSGLFSSRSVGSSATSRDSAWDILSSSALDLAASAIGSSGSGITHGSISSGSSLLDNVSPVSAVPSLATAQMSPATASVMLRCCLPSGQVSAPIRSSVSWSAWPWSARPCPDTCTAASARSVPENTRTRLTRPTYGSEVVLTTSASSGPAGSQASPVTGVPSRVVTDGSGCSSGDGKAWVITSSSSARPMPRWRGHRQHRVEAAPGDRLLQVLDQHLRVDLLTGQVPLHEGLVFALLDDALDQLTAERLHLLNVRRSHRALAAAGAGVVEQLL